MVPNKEGISLTREEASTRCATGPSLERSTGNPEREVETTRTVKGAFSGATKLGGDPRGVLCGNPRVKAKMRLSSRGRSRSWRWEQEAEGSVGLFGGVLCDPATGTEVLLWRPGSREADPRIGMRRRYRGLGRAFSKMRGLVVAGDEQDGEITCVHQGFRGVLKQQLQVFNSVMINKKPQGYSWNEAGAELIVDPIGVFTDKDMAATCIRKCIIRQKGNNSLSTRDIVSRFILKNFSRYSESFCHFGFSDKYICFQVITSLPPPEEGPNLSFHTLDEQLDLLGKVLSTGDEMIGVEHLEEDSDGKALLKARCSAGLMSAFSGAGGMVYMEYNKGKGAKKKDPAKRHTLFKKRYT
ncbi:uncharacterized protein LOC123425895 [Hordeum vulgare subsp. vulgare]|uniref:uncharacterized protein LOC123425895 n=1 Tax=Hordeum vulgare subsp. vulgare TaxID=112509 RepID=UPI001D1A4848|nr:uncharacterized protein LOC123425895 [Hordeum vulgare subsp. vulgare]